MRAGDGQPRSVSVLLARNGTGLLEPTGAGEGLLAWCLLALEDLDLILDGLLFLGGMGGPLGGTGEPGAPVGSRILGVSGILCACVAS